VPTSTCYPPKLKLKLKLKKVAETQTHFENKCDDYYDDADNSSVKLPLPSHVKSITSTSNPFVKHCLKLRHSSSYRHSHGSALVVGATPIR
jgi:TrmH family RNA methyltransferase